jgi:predicted RNase H-like HicB family nuclease
MKTYTAVFERDEKDWWFASVREVPGCHTQGRSLRQARERIREALAACVGASASKARVREDVHLPAAARRALARQRRARVKLERDADQARETTREAVRVLTRELGLTTRDAGELLGLSHQRVQQLLGSGRSAA